MADRVDEIIAQWGRTHPDLDVSPMGVFGRLSRLSRITDRALQRTFSVHGLQHGEFDLLATLRRADTEGTGLTAGELARSAMVTSGAITNRLDRLVAKGLVTRATDPDSRRTIRVRLTTAGTDLLEAALHDHVANEHRLLAPLDADQRRALADLLRLLLEAEEDAADAP